MTGSEDKTLKLWSAAAPFSCTANLSDHEDEVVSCAWSSDGRTIASVGHDNTTKLWDVATMNCCATLDQPELVRSCSWSPDGRTLATGCDDGSVTLWDMQRS
jgi:WD40 repeat protein